MLGAPLSIIDQRDDRLIGVYNDPIEAMEIAIYLWERIPIVTRPSVNPYQVKTVFVGKSCYDDY
jgi:hypothetical protein